jgi:preprotein translocase SecE subunit
MTKESKNKRHFLKDVKTELKKVVWLTPKQLIKSTLAVALIVIVTALIVFLLDITFETITKKGIDNIKSTILEEKQTNLVDFNTISNSTTQKTEIEVEK